MFLTALQITLILFSIPYLLAPQQAVAADILETFSYPDGPLPSPWIVVRGVNGRDARIAAGKAILGDVENGIAVYNQEFTDLDLEVEARNARGDLSTGVVFRYNDLNNWYETVFNPANDVVEIWRQFQGALSQIAGTSLPIGTETLKLRVRVTGSLFVVYLDGVERLRVNDASLPSGKIGLLAEATTRSEYDNLVVRDLATRSQSFRVTVWGRDFLVWITSNSTVAGFTFDEPGKSILFTVAGRDGTTGASNVTFPSVLLNGTFTVTLDGAPLAFRLTQNATHISVSTTYRHSQKTLRITGTVVIPEFPFGTAAALALVAAVALFTLRLSLRRMKREREDRNPGAWVNTRCSDGSGSVPFFGKAST